MSKKIAMSLRGGGARCAAYFGLLRFLEEEKVEIDAFIGASGGAIVGILYSVFGSVDKSLDYFAQIKPIKFLTFKSLFQFNKFDSIAGGDKIAKDIGYKQLEELPKKVFVQATNVQKGKSEIFDKGELSMLIGATASVPGMGSIVKIAGEPYIDGEVTSGYDAEFMHDKDYFVIGANVDKLNYNKYATKNLLSRALGIAMAEINRLDGELNKVDLLLDKVLEDDSYNIFNFSKSKKIAELGYQYAKSRREIILNSIHNS